MRPTHFSPVWLSWCLAGAVAMGATGCGERSATSASPTPSSPQPTHPAGFSIQSTFASGPIYWRIFDQQDRVRLIGRREGVILPNQTVPFPEDRPYQLEIRVGNVSGKILLEASTAVVYTNQSPPLLVSPSGAVTWK